VSRETGLGWVSEGDVRLGMDIRPATEAQSPAIQPTCSRPMIWPNAANCSTDFASPNFTNLNPIYSRANRTPIHSMIRTGKSIHDETPSLGGRTLDRSGVDARLPAGVCVAMLLGFLLFVPGLVATSTASQPVTATTGAVTFSGDEATLTGTVDDDGTAAQAGVQWRALPAWESLPGVRGSAPWEQVKVTHYAPPVMVCGQTIAFSPSGTLEETFARAGRFRLANPLRLGESFGSPRPLIFVTSCNAGVSVSISPRGSVKIGMVAHTADHRIAGLSIVPQRSGPVVITVTRPQGAKTVIKTVIHKESSYRPVSESNEVTT